MEATELIWFNNELIPWDQAKIHVLTHALHYGSGVFEGIRFYETDQGPAIFRLPEHVDRLFRSAETLAMKIPYTKEEIEQAITDTVRKNKISSGYIRPISFFGYGKMGLNPKGAPVNTAIALWPWGAYLNKDAVNIKTSKYIRIHPQASETWAKITGHYINSIMASLEICREGYDEALLLDFEGNVAEGPGENFFLVKDDQIFTPPAGRILEGITRRTIFELVQEMGFSLQEKIIKPADIFEADEAFFTGTAAEVQPISSLDDQVIGQGGVGKFSKKIREIYLEVVHGRQEKFTKWLTYIK